ncbi:SPOR domain-containing protein [Campylobacter canadensis]|uniref:SPOR domain-containing protein n=1 Tax=Campylobacter canadensis TaxID=449520 RepID=A0ABS7WUE5_9BACT|nr:SPOR domain-containing protein [Campylobacter canadensis]MBZ7987649.1 SPOR domain-containing protein [Campylobacter canadensis]MBZ7995028.1 SPOR domain-containing protein [Campylobacter canadensis]MBZ7996970.1 SPOR domain-containing protein [Campylobacter canadensis]MBZ7998814.1 SPOR domain-containing protein [Campylobacter canadensis]MBZ8000449.1 SPOR domain-containing protein [Campylobacter canadensis]
MEENKFDELLIQTDNKQDKHKKMIFQIILFIIVVLLVAIGVKIVLNQDSTSDNTQQNINTNFESKDDNDVFENIAVKQEQVDSGFNEIANKIQQNNSNINTQLPQAKEESKQQGILDVIEKTQSKEEQKEIKVVKEAVKEKVADKKDNIKQAFDSIQTNKPVKTQAQQTNKQNVQTANKPSNSGNTFIQVYAGRNLDLNSHEIKKLDNLGLNYKVVKDDTTGISRVIVGPYSDSKEALKYIRENVKKDAFIYRAK